MKTATMVFALVLAAGGAARSADPDPYVAGLRDAARGISDPERAWRNYALNCQGCHRPDGAGTADSAPALAGHIGLFTWLKGGRTYLGQVPGVATAPLPNDQLSELLNWVLRRFDATHVAPDFAPYTPAEVGRLRVTPLRTEAAAVRATLLSGAPSRP